MPRLCRRFFPSLLFFALPVAVLLSGCAGNSSRWNPEDYTVKSGDTVYGIAWRYELDPEEFAAWNRLGPARQIKPGQRLHTRPPANYHAGDEVAGRETERQVVYAPTQTQRLKPAVADSGRDAEIASSARWIKAEAGDTLYSISRRSGVSVKQLAQLNRLKPPYMIRPGQTIFLQPLNMPAAGSTTAGDREPATSAGVTARAGRKPVYRWPPVIHWRQPAKGKVVRKFNRWKNDAKGIDIAGKPGDRVLAAADGKVVYSGNGLISYGNLVIIKHNKNYLSAYAYNRKLLVREGDIVKAGQKIAEMGAKDRHKALLHFEIRKNGKPVDPLKYIPW